MADAERVNDMLDALNEAMEIHAQNAIKGLSFNKTELAEVVDITRRDEGWYIVWNGSTRYLAFSENTSYKMGMKVYVNIPNNDFGSQKTIIGQYKEDNQQAVFFKSPLDGYLPKTDNILNDIGTYQEELEDGSAATYIIGERAEDWGDGEFSLLANWDNSELGSEEQNGELHPKSYLKEIFRTKRFLGNTSYNGSFKYMAITADVKTALKSFNVMGGNYGIQVGVEWINNDDLVQNSEIIRQIFSLSTKNMIGSVYNFDDAYFKQEALFNISNYQNYQLSQIVVTIYQDGTFKDNENYFVPYKYTVDNDNYSLLDDNIFIKNIDIRFGTDLPNTKDTVIISSDNGLKYDTATTDTLNKKNISLDWTHLDPETNKMETVNNSALTKISDLKNKVVKIHWYRDSIYSLADYTQIIENTKANDEAKLDIYNQWVAALKDETVSQEERDELMRQVIASYNLDTDSALKYSKNEDGDIELVSTSVLNQIKQAVSKVENERKHNTVASAELAGSFWKPDNATGSERNWQWRNFLPDTTRKQSKVKVIIEYGPALATDPEEIDRKSDEYTIAYSNELVFENNREIVDLSYLDKVDGLTINYSDNSDGNYPLYNGATGEILNKSDFTKTRKWIAEFFSIQTKQSYFNGNETIIWQVPKVNTMILMNKTFYDNATLLEENNELFTTYGDVLKYNQNYYYIMRNAEDEEFAVNAEQTYRIAQYYNKACVNNTIYCYVIKNNDITKTDTTLMFSQHGSSGTDYTFSIGLGPEVIEAEGGWEIVGPPDTALTIGEKHGDKYKYHEIVFDLFNSKNEKIDLTLKQKNAIIKPWVTGKGKGFYSGKDNVKNLEFIYLEENGEEAGVTTPYYSRVAVRAKDLLGENADTNAQLKDFYYIVLQAFVNEKVIQGSENDEVLGRVDFVQYFPLHVRAKDTYWVLDGSDYIVYDDKGANPTCYNDVYRLFNPEDNSIKESGFNINIKGLTQEIQEIQQDSEATEAEKTAKIQQLWSFYPSIGENGKLIVSPLYIESLQKDIAIYCENLYTCPLVIIQNKYQIPALNHWNGDLIVDKEGNKILTSMVGAGHKNGDNTFSGVIMGDIQHDNQKLTGLFGYDGGAQTFGLNTNGQAFIGKADVGRIYVDGNTGRITSSAREAYDADTSAGDPRGTEINLKENYIDIQGITPEGATVENKSRIHIDSEIRPTNKGGTNAYFSIHSNNGNELIHISDTAGGYYLQSDNYTNSQGLKIDLGQGTINAGNGTFAVAANGETTLTSLTFKNPETGAIQATGIQPHWKTFVTDVIGSVTMQKVTVTINDIPVPHTIETYSYQTDTVYTTNQDTADFYWYSDDNSYNMTSDSSYRAFEVEAPRLSPSIDPDVPRYQHHGRVRYDYTVSTPTVTGPYSIGSTTTTEYVDGKGSTDVPVVTAINFTIKKVSMWALTNSSEQEKTYAINAKGDAEYTGSVITREMKEV